MTVELRGKRAGAVEFLEPTAKRVWSSVGWKVRCVHCGAAGVLGSHFYHRYKDRPDGGCPAKCPEGRTRERVKAEAVKHADTRARRVSMFFDGATLSKIAEVEGTSVQNIAQCVHTYAGPVLDGVIHLLTPDQLREAVLNAPIAARRDVVRTAKKLAQEKSSTSLDPPGHGV